MIEALSDPSLRRREPTPSVAAVGERLRET